VVRTVRSLPWKPEVLARGARTVLGDQTVMDLWKDRFLYLMLGVGIGNIPALIFLFHILHEARARGCM